MLLAETELRQELGFCDGIGLRWAKSVAASIGADMFVLPEKRVILMIRWVRRYRARRLLTSALAPYCS
jgi:hypothetical protein